MEETITTFHYQKHWSISGKQSKNLWNFVWLITQCSDTINL